MALKRIITTIGLCALALLAGCGTAPAGPRLVSLDEALAEAGSAGGN